MSATGRKNVRLPGDQYDTPPDLCDAMMALLPPGLVLDPCCGVGAMLNAAKRDRRQARGIEIDPSRAEQATMLGHEVEVADALSMPVHGWGKPPVIASNPPYRKALEFVERSLVEVAPGGTVAMLLRVGFAASKKRASFHSHHPSDMVVISRRPSFVGGGTDACEYAVFLWGPGRGGRWSLL
jgi:SAM-dependent methyltransferase